MNTVQYILKTKGVRVWKVPIDATVLEALQLMAEKQTGSVVVMDGDRVAGIFTERDFARKVGLYEIKPGAINPTINGENMMPITDTKARMMDKMVKALDASSRASSFDFFCRYSVNTGTKETVSEPSPSNRLNV